VDLICENLLLFGETYVYKEITSSRKLNYLHMVTLYDQPSIYLSALSRFLSSPDYEQYVNEGVKLPALVCVITGNTLFML